MSSYIVAFDIGTGAGRAVLFDERGKKIAVRYEEWSYRPCPWGAKAGLVFDADDFFARLARQSRALVEDAGVRAGDIAAVSVVSQRQGMVFIDGGGRELYSAPCVDLRGEEERAEIIPLGQKIREITGIAPHGMYGPGRLLWFRKHRPEILEKTRTLLMISDWFAWRLTGKAVSEISVASSSQFLANAARSWSEELIGLFDLPRQIFPELIPANRAAGRVTREAARASGLPEGTPVFSAGGDTQAALAGMGAFTPGTIAAVAGSTTPVMLVSGTPRSFPGADTVCHVAEGLWCVEANVKFTGVSVRWTREIIKAPASSSGPGRSEGSLPADGGAFKRMTELAGTVPIGSGGAAAYLGAEIAGEDLGENYGGFLFPVPWNIYEITAAHLYRAVLESTIFPVRANTEYLVRENGTGAEDFDFLVCGGQTKSEFFSQSLADLLDRPILVSGSEETSALGGALSAAVGIGLYGDYRTAAQNMVTGARRYNPDKQRAGEYERAYEHWRSLRKHLRGIGGQNV
jgi:autoinducer 2 (AI-2) kinase